MVAFYPPFFSWKTRWKNSENWGGIIFDAVISISHSHHKVSCFYFENDNRRIVRPEAEHWTPISYAIIVRHAYVFYLWVSFWSVWTSWCACTKKKREKNVAKLLEWAYDERNCSLITHTNGPMGKVLNIWGQQQFTEWFMSSDKTQSFHFLSLSLALAVLVFVYSFHLELMLFSVDALPFTILSR